MAAALISIKGLSSIFVVFFGGNYLRQNNNGLYLFAYITTIFSLLLMGVGVNTIQLGVASLVNGVGTGLITLINFAEVGSIEGEKGKIAGFFSFGNAAGTIIGPTIGGLIGAAFGVQAIFLAFMLPFGALTVRTFLETKKSSDISENIIETI